MENASEIISAEEDVDKFSKYLRCEGGKGKIEEKGFVYRQVIANVIPLGIGLTENPAADVKGVATTRTLEEEMSLLDLASKVRVEKKEANEEAADTKRVVTEHVGSGAVTEHGGSEAGSSSSSSSSACNSACSSSKNYKCLRT